MNPIYKYYLQSGVEEAVEVHPILDEGVAVEWNRESDYMFHRRTLSGKLTFVREDYEIIMPSNQNLFGTLFTLEIKISYDRGANWSSYWIGTFYHTDCEIDVDNQIIRVTPQVKDDYTNILAGLDKEYNLIDLKPEMQPINIDKRSVMQFYVAGSSRVACVLSDMTWEEDCEPTTSYNTIVNNSHFSFLFSQWVYEVVQQGSPTIPSIFQNKIGLNEDPTPITNGNYRLRYGSYSGQSDVYIIEELTYGQVMWYGREVISTNVIQLQPVTESGASGYVRLHIYNYDVYGRYLTDKANVQGHTTYLYPSDDFVNVRAQYNYVIPANLDDNVEVCWLLTDTPTQWGLYEPNQYYRQPYSPVDWIPLAQSQWGRMSFWFSYQGFESLLEQKMRSPMTINNIYPLSSVIKRILHEVAPELSFDSDISYSEFMFDTDPITGDSRDFFITPKSNIAKINYNEPATQAPITLKTIFNMLRDCYKCYWFIDASTKKLRIENILYFLNGGDYEQSANVGIDLTTQICVRNNKTIDFGQNTITYDKPDMTSRYEFNWMDEVTLPFKGEPLNIISRFVNIDKIEKIDIAQFTSDIDFIIANPDEISLDGFVLLAAYEDDGVYKLPYKTYGSTVIQNAYCAFIYLQTYYAYDLPASQYRIGDGNTKYAIRVKRIVNQVVNFPCLTDPDIQELVKTAIGEGKIEKLSINLSSRNGKATLKFKAENDSE